jgi:hypothetical protein
MSESTKRRRSGPATVEGGFGTGTVDSHTWPDRLARSSTSGPRCSNRLAFVHVSFAGTAARRYYVPNLGSWAGQGALLASHWVVGGTLFAPRTRCK